MILNCKQDDLKKIMKLTLEKINSLLNYIRLSFVEIFQSFRMLRKETYKQLGEIDIYSEMNVPRLC